MIENIKIFNNKIKSFCQSKFSKIIDINEKYAQPKIGMSKTVQISLLLLRIYLIFLILLFAVKFIMVVK